MGLRVVVAYNERSLWGTVRKRRITDLERFLFAAAIATCPKLHAMNPVFYRVNHNGDRT